MSLNGHNEQMNAKAPEGTPIYHAFPSFPEWFTGTFDSSVVDRYTEMLKTSKANTSQEQLDAALEVATRYAAVDTGAIEGLYSVDRGFTRTIATQTATWQAALDAKGPRVRRAIDDALNAYDYVLDAATRSVLVTEVWIRELHEFVCASQDTFTVHTQQGPQERPLPKGVYKTMPNSPTNLSTGRVHAYAPVSDTRPEMSRLVGELRSESFLSAHPVVQAAYAHYAYVCIHPFADGNGRVARALASTYLYRSPGVPLVIFADQRNEYLDALEAADAGDAGPFITFIEQRTVDAVGIVRTTLSRSATPIGESVAALTAFYAAEGLDAELIAAADRLKGMLRNEFRKQISALGLPPQLELSAVNSSHGREAPPIHFAAVGPAGELILWARSTWPIQLQLRHGFFIYVRASGAAPSDLVCAPTEGGDPLEVWLREIAPAETESLKLKLTAWCERQIERMVEAIRVASEVAARRS